MSDLDTIAAKVATIMTDPAVRFGVGRLALREHNTPPMICAIPATSSLEGTKSPGRHDIVVGANTVAAREIVVRNLTIEWWCWALTATDAEQLMKNLIVALSHGDIRSCRPTGERWVSEEEDASWQNLGACVVLDVVHQIPVVDVALPLQAGADPIATPVTGPVAGVHSGELNGGDGCDD